MISTGQILTAAAVTAIAIALAAAALRWLPAALHRLAERVPVLGDGQRGHCDLELFGRASRVHAVRVEPGQGHG